MLGGWNTVNKYGSNKNGFPHFMLKEIYQQPEAVRTMIQGCLQGPDQITLPNFSLSHEDIRRIARITIAASGSSRHAGIVGEFMLERMAHVPVEVDFASQYCYRDPVVGPNELTIFISQSGTTIDTLAALHEASQKGSKSLAICNVADSPLTRNADATLLTYAGEEVAIAATKSFTTQLTALFLLSAYIAQVRGKSHAAIEAALQGLSSLPEQIRSTLSTDDTVRAFAQEFYQYRDCIYMGRDIDYPIALEGALKLKEISYIHAEGYPTGELKHGPTALVNEHLPIVVLAMHDQSDEGSVLRYGKSVSNIREFVERGIPVLAIITEGDKEVSKIAPHSALVPSCPWWSQLLSEVIPSHWLASHSAFRADPSGVLPRNLSKPALLS